MKHLDLICILCLITIGMSSCDSDGDKDTRPNIIYIMVDDMGYADLSSYGRTDYQTPQIDKFVSESLNFINAYAAAPICTPTRVGLMTGKYPARNEIGVREPLLGNGQDSILGLSSKYPTLSSLMKASGYETALYGKWHLGRTPQSSPNAHGFDNFFGILDGSSDYIDHDNLYKNDQPIQEEGYLTDLITDYTIDFIKKEHDKPFFISLQYNSPHWPWQVPGDEPYPDSVDYRDLGTPEKFAMMIKNLDNNIGRVISALQEANLEKSTLVIFTSDNGGERFSNMGPYRGLKGDLFEGGIAVPAAVRWPNKISPGITKQPVITMDWTVTMLEIAEASIPEDLTFDGISLLTHFNDPDLRTPRKFYWRTSYWQVQDALRNDKWKYLKTDQGEFLFDLENDPGEEKDLKEVEIEKFNQLKREFQELDSDMVARLFQPDEN